MVKTRMQLLANTAKGQVAYTGYRHAIRSILKEEGAKGFYKVSHNCMFLCIF
jgi:Mitochondrial carrier protein